LSKKGGDEAYNRGRGKTERESGPGVSVRGAHSNRSDGGKKRREGGGREPPKGGGGVKKP